MYDTKFAKVFEDTVELSDGSIIDDYSVISFPHVVIIVATNAEGSLLVQDEYKYAINKTILSLPSGGMNRNGDPVETAKKELAEETGYVSDEVELVETLYEYPSKMDRVLFIVRMKNIRKTKEVDRELTEIISNVRFISSGYIGDGKKFNTTYAISALALTLPEFVR